MKVFIFLLLGMLLFASCSQHDILTPDGLDVEQSLLTDARDGEVYATTTIDGVTWMAEDLRFSTTNSIPHQQDPNIELYPYNETSTACPPQWSLSTYDDWEHLRTYANDSKLGKVLKSRYWSGTDQYNLNIQATGYYSDVEGYFSPLNNPNDQTKAVYWTSSPYKPISEGNAVRNDYRTLVVFNEYEDELHYGNGKIQPFSAELYACRCVLTSSRK